MACCCPVVPSPSEAFVETAELNPDDSELWDEESEQPVITPPPVVPNSKGGPVVSSYSVLNEPGEFFPTEEEEEETIERTTPVGDLPYSDDMNTVTITNTTGEDQTIVFTPGGGQQPIPDLFVPAGETVEIKFPPNWNGNLRYKNETGEEGFSLAELNFGVDIDNDGTGETTFANVSNIFGESSAGGFHLTSKDGLLNSGFSEHVGYVGRPREGDQEKVKNLDSPELNDEARYLIQKRQELNANTYIGTGAGAGDAHDPEDRFSTATTSTINIRLT